MTELSPDNRRRLRADIEAKSGDVWAAQMVQWVRDAEYYSRRLVELGASASPAERALFVIRAYGTLDEVRDAFRSHIELQERLFPGQPLDAEPLEAKATRELVRELDDALAALSGDEQAYLRYRRDTECHPALGYYRLRAKKDGGLKETIAVFGRDWTIENFDAAMVQMLRGHGSEEAIIGMLARKLGAPLGRALVVLRALCEPTPPWKR